MRGRAWVQLQVVGVAAVSRAVRRCAVLLPILAAALAGCGGSPQTQARDAVASVRSWTATLHLAGDQWMRGNAPSAYASQTADLAKQRLEQELITVRGGPALPILRSELPRLTQPAESAGRLSAAIARGDRSAAGREVARLAAMERDLAALARRVAGEGG
jgi:hypothetical protein